MLSGRDPDASGVEWAGLMEKCKRELLCVYRQMVQIVGWRSTRPSRGHVPKHSNTLVGPLGSCVGTSDHATIHLFVVVAFREYVAQLHLHYYDYILIVIFCSCILLPIPLLCLPIDLMGATPYIIWFRSKLLSPLLLFA